MMIVQVTIHIFSSIFVSPLSLIYYYTSTLIEHVNRVLRLFFATQYRAVRTLNHYMLWCAYDLLIL